MRLNLLYGLSFSAFLTGCGGMASSPAPVEEPLQARAPVTPPVAAPSKSAAPTAATRAAPAQSEVLFRVLSSIGVDYKYGGNSHTTGFDCSGLVAHVYREGYGVALPRNTYGQSQAGQPVTLDELQPGDLVFYNTLNKPFSHVGIYVGDGRFIHAPRTGAAVRLENLNSAYWSKRWNGARRISASL